MPWRMTKKRCFRKHPWQSTTSEKAGEHAQAVFLLRN